MHPALRAALDDRGYATLTPVQTAVLDPELTGRDLLVSAQTGSGKTLGFGLAISATLLHDIDAFAPAAAPLALVIAPTRELALQVKRELGWLYAKAGAVMASCVGGMDMRDERRALERGAHIVAATPGRLRDHIMRGSIDLTAVRAVVLDEADEMLDLGFREDLEFILGEVPADRQTLLFSATVPPMIAQLATSFQKDAERIVTRSETPQHADIDYRAMLVSDRDVDNAVINTLRFYEAPNALVFANTRAMVNRLVARLSNRGFDAVALSGELSQSERTHALQAMRDGRAQVCVATDVAARGIDLPKLDLVVHAELPSSHETLLHRSGRTGRAGRKGVSALIVTPRNRKKAERLLGWAKVRADWGNAPSATEVRARDEERLYADPSWQEPITEDEAESAARLMSAFTPEQIAAGYLRIMRTLHTPPEELTEVGAKPEPRPEFGPSVWFSVSGGRDAGAEPRRLLPMICKAGGLTKDDIGAIRVRTDQSFVQIRQEAVEGFLGQVGDAMTLEEGAQLTQLDAAPSFEDKGPRGKPRSGPGPRKPYGDKPGGKKPYGDKKPYEKKAYGDKPGGGKPYGAKHNGDKPGRDNPAGRKPSADKPVRAKPHRAEPNPAVQELKPAARPGSKPTPKPAAKSPRKRAFDEGEGGNATLRRSASDPGQSLRAGRKPKGPPPPKGKPSSKKNRVRAAAAGGEVKGFGKPFSKGPGKPGKGAPARGKPPHAGGPKRPK